MSFHLHQSGKYVHRRNFAFSRADFVRARGETGFWPGLLIGIASGFTIGAFTLGKLF